MSLDPYQVLGVNPAASEEAVRAAYLEKVKAHPPDSAPAEFERVRDAYDALRDPRRRARAALLALDPRAPFAALLEGRPSPRPFFGPAPWRALLEAPPSP
jgi:curved DNA-binding protein CbpA